MRPLPLILSFICVGRAFAQDPSSLGDFELRPGRAKPRVDFTNPVPPSQIENPAETSTEAGVYLPGRWAGFSLLFSNYGITRGLFRATQDETLIDDSTDKSFGLGVHLDVALGPSQRSSFRIRAAYLRARVKAGEEVLAQHPSASLESGLNIANLTHLSRRHWDDEDYDLWAGVGIDIRYAFSSSFPGSAGLRNSSLRGSSAVSPVLAVGAEMPFAEGQDLTLEADWDLLRGFTGAVGLRTSL